MLATWRNTPAGAQGGADEDVLCSPTFNIETGSGCEGKMQRDGFGVANGVSDNLSNQLFCSAKLKKKKILEPFGKIEEKSFLC